MIITFIGNDGSGKTTIAKEMYNFFEELGFNTFYKHEYDYVLLKHLFKLVGKKRLQKSRNEMIVEKKKSWKYQIWPILVWIDVYLQFLYFKIFRRKTIILLDRYIYDHYMSFEYLGYLNSFTRWLYTHFPKPDISILFWVEAKIAYERKKDTHIYEISFYQKQLKRYLEMGKKINISTINTKANIKDTKRKTLKLFFQNKQFIKMFIEHCSKNRILPCVLDEYKLESICKDFENIKSYLHVEENKVIKTLNFIKNIPVNNLIFKTYRNFKWIPFNDIDLLVSERDIEKFLDFIKNKDGKINITEPEKFDCWVKDLLKIEPHLNVTWRGLHYIDSDFLWERPRKVKMLNIPINIPNYEADLLIHVAQIIYENSFMRFNEYLYINYLLSQKLNMKMVLKQANNYGWGKQFREFVSLIKDSKLQFPYFLPFNIILKNYWSKIKYDIKTNEFNINELSVYVRDLFVFIFWRFRYKINGKIPFDIVHKYEV